MQDLKQGMLVLSTLMAGAGCARSEADVRPPLSPSSYEFADKYELVDSTVLEEPDTAPIARLASLTIATNGTILIADLSEGNVKVYSDSGRLLRTLGRKGDGPGEFRQPIYTAVDPSGRIYVVEPSPAKVAVFDGDGRFQREFKIDGAQAVQSFAVLGGGRFLFSGKVAADSALFITDSLGKVEEMFLSRNRLRATDDPANRAWDSARRSMALWLGDTVLVVSSVGDSLWFVSLKNGSVSSVPIVVPGRIRPLAPREPFHDMPGLMRWTSSFHAAPSVKGSAGLIIIPYVQGILTHNDPTILLSRYRGTWEVLEHAPAVLAANDSTLVALLGPYGRSSTAVAFYRRRHS